jgi:hypothetical protein
MAEIRVVDEKLDPDPHQSENLDPCLYEARPSDKRMSSISKHVVS